MSVWGRQRILRIASILAFAAYGLLWLPNPAGAQQPTDNTVAFGETVGAAFDGDSAHEWHFEGQAREIITLEVLRIGGRFTPRLLLLAPDGTTIPPFVNENDAISQTLVFRQGLPEDGTYTVRVVEEDSTSDGFLSISEYALTLTYRGRHREDIEEGISPLPRIGRDELPDTFTEEGTESAALEITFYGADQIATTPPYIIEGAGFNLRINNANPIAEGIDAIAFTTDGITIRSTSGAIFFTDQNIAQLSHSLAETEILLGNGQQITTDFYRIESIQAVDGLLRVHTQTAQTAFFDGEIFRFVRRGGGEGEGPNAEPINLFAVDDAELQTDLRRWDLLSAVAGELRVFYGEDLRFFSDQYAATLLERGNSLRPELDPPSTNTRFLDIRLPRAETPLTLAIDPLGMGDVALRDGELRVLPLDGREISNVLANVESLLVEDEAVRVERVDGTYFLSLPDGTSVTTSAPILRNERSLPAEANFQPRNYNNLGTTIFDYTPDLTPLDSVLPVNRILGNFVYPVQDFSVPSSSLSLDWKRMYNSMAPAAQTPLYMEEAPQRYLLGGMGAQWRHSFQTELDITNAPLGEVHLILPDGSANLFREGAETSGRFRSRNLLSWTIERAGGLTGHWRGYTTEGLIYHFDRAGRIERIEDAFGETLLFAPAPRQMIEREDAAGGFFAVEPYGRRIELYRNEANQITLARDVQGRTIRYGYSDQHLTSVAYADDEVATYAYDNGQLTEIRDVRSPYHQAIDLTYDDRGRTLSYTINPDEASDSRALTTSFTYEQQSTRESVTVSGEERVTTWNYDANFRLTEIVLPRPEWVYRYNYDPGSGHLSEIVQPNRTALRYEIDDYGYVTEFRDPIFAANSTYSLTYDSPNGYQRRLLRIDYPEVNDEEVYREYRYTTAEDGTLSITETRPISGEEGDVFVTVQRYDARGRLLRVEEPSPDGGTIHTEYAYDDFGYVSQIEEGNGLRLLLFQHDIGGRLVMLVDGRGTTTTLVWDDDRDRVRRLLTDGVERRYEYDAHGNLTRYSTQDVVTEYEYNGLNQPIAVTDALGNVIRYEYDAVGNLLVRTFEDGTSERYTYDALNHLTSATSRGGLLTTYQTTLNTEGNRTRYSVTNPAQEETIYVYDAIGRLREVLFNDSDGNRIQTYNLTYNPLGYVTRIEETHVPGGRALTVQYDLLGHPLLSSIDGVQTIYSYNAAGWLESITEPNGSSTSYTYDALGNITLVTLPDGAQQQYRYDENGNLVAFTDPLGGETIYTYDDLNRLVSTVAPDGSRTNYDYDLRGNLTAIVDPRGNRISVEYDALDRLTRVLDALGNETRYEYDELNQLTRIVPPGGLDITTLTYDLEGNIVSSSQPGNREFLYSRDSLGRIISVTNPLGQSTLFSYNNIGLVGRTVNALGNEAAYLWNGAGRLVEFTSPDGKRYAYASDSIGRLTAMTDVELDSQIAVNTRIEYDPSGFITAIRRGTSATIAGEDAILYQYDYDDAGRLVSFLEPEADAPWQFRYDAAGQLIAAVDPLGIQTRYEYDSVGNLTRIITAAGTEEEAVEIYEYDEAGNIIAYTAPDGLLTRYEYDANNRLVEVREVAEGTERSTSFVYDERGRIVRVSDPLEQLTQIEYDLGITSVTRFPGGTEESPQTYRYFFDEVNNLTRILLPGEQLINMTYNLLGQRVRYIDAESNGWSYAYDAAGRLTQISDPQGNVITYEYDEADRVIGITYPTGAQETFAYDNQGNLRTVILPENGAGFRETIQYRFDQNGNLVSIGHESEEDVRTLYAYDDLGRVTQITQPDGTIIDLEYDAQGRLVLVQTPDSISRRTYDAAGHLLSISNTSTEYLYQYDDFGQVEIFTNAAGLEIRYEYDALGNVTVRDAGDYGRIDTIYDALSRPVRVVMNGEGLTIDYNENGWRTAIERDNGLRTTYAYDDNGRILSVIHLNPDGERLDGIFYEYDAVGNIIRITRDDRWSVLFSYDESQELISERWLNEINQLVYSVNYTYDFAGNRVEEVVRSRQENPVRTLYVYNENNQLIEEYRDVPLSIETGSAISFGGIALLFPLGFAVRYRRKSWIVVIGLLIFAAPLFALAQDFIDETPPSVVYFYDENGSLIEQKFDENSSLNYTYDSLNRLVQVRGRDADGERVNSVYAYDALGRVSEITLAGERYELLYAAHELLAIRDVASGTERIYAGAFPGESLLQETPQGTRWLLHDGLGNLRKLATDAGELLGEDQIGYNYTGFGAVFTPYGEDRAYALDAPERLFLGTLYDPDAELYLMGARAYDPHLGRFLQRDPVRHDPQGNLYTYVYNRPTAFTDPAGLTPDAVSDGLLPPEYTVDPLQGLDSPLIPQPPAPPDVHALQATENARILQVATDARFEMNDFAAVLDPTGCDLYLTQANPIPAAVRSLLAQKNAFPIGLFDANTGAWLPPTQPDPTDFVSPFVSLQDALPLLQASFADAPPLHGCGGGIHLPAQPNPLASLQAAQQRASFAEELQAVPMFAVLADVLPELLNVDENRLLAERPRIPTEQITPVVNPPLPGQLTEMRIQTEAIYRSLLLPQPLPNELDWRMLTQVNDYSPPVIYRSPDAAPLVPRGSIDGG